MTDIFWMVGAMIWGFACGLILYRALMMHRSSGELHLVEPANPKDDTMIFLTLRSQEEIARIRDKELVILHVKIGEGGRIIGE